MNNAGHLFMQAARGDMGPDPPPATLMSSRRDFIGHADEVAKRFMRAIFDANDAYSRIAARHGRRDRRMERTRHPKIVALPRNE